MGIEIEGGRADEVSIANVHVVVNAVSGNRGGNVDIA
ncbi:hypothetical protein AWB80_07586 [Caballeronia pedi]|uniref:Uncharacterized protein n=1 Tax=Caballeronia pedi TaxID=1777141 RepID=A0A158DWF5_9BURK|nr:hypothetical protein AWB80_07586 [Caballeronia pedi]